jgi:hypothetical protein
LNGSDFVPAMDRYVGIGDCTALLDWGPGREACSKTGGFVWIGAGVTHSGTDEAGRILSDSEALTPIFRSLTQG